MARDESCLPLEESKKLEELLLKWTSISKKVVNDISNLDSNSLEKKNPNYLIALGALQSYLRLAIQAKEACDAN